MLIDVASDFDADGDDDVDDDDDDDDDDGDDHGDDDDDDDDHDDDDDDDDGGEEEDDDDVDVEEEENWPRTSPGSSFCASLRSRSAVWTFHKSHFAWKSTGKMQDTPDTTSINHRALTVTVRTPQCGHIVRAKK